MVDPAIIEKIREYLQNLADKGIPASFAVLFGSQVTGQTHPYSDIDLVIVSPKFDETITREDINILWRVAARTDCRIEPVPCGQKQWLSDTGIPLFEIARLEGQTVYAA
jgi:predicted nucleotidyltransferase